MTPREKILFRITALQSKTTANGCTEQEAIAAMDLAQKLLNQWEVEEEELFAATQKRPSYEISREKIFIGAEITGAARAAGAIARLVNCRTIFSNTNPIILNIFGDRPDRELFNILYERVEEAMQTEYAIYQHVHKNKNKRGSKAAFESGMAARIQIRIHEMLKPVQSNSTALVVTKINEVNAAMREVFPRVSKINTLATTKNDHASAAGAAAGNRFQISPQISQSHKRIG